MRAGQKNVSHERAGDRSGERFYQTAHRSGERWYRGRSRHGCRRGFSIVELLFVIIILGLLMGLLLVGFTRVRKTGRMVQQRVTVGTFMQGLSQFDQDFGFTPPLLREQAQPATGLEVVSVNGLSRVKVYTKSDLLAPTAGWQPTATNPYLDNRFSTASLAVFLGGALNESVTPGRPVGTGVPPFDGVPGGGYLAPEVDELNGLAGFALPAYADWDGQGWKRSGRTYASFLDAGRQDPRLVVPGVGSAANAVAWPEYRDLKGAAYRYYRWNPGRAVVGNPRQFADPRNVGEMNVPAMVGDPRADVRLNSGIGGKPRYAMVGAGADGVFGDEPIGVIRAALGDNASVEATARIKAARDNVVEVGP